MTHYIQFVSTLAFGLLGVGMVLKILMDNLFNEFDPVEATGKFYREWQSRGMLRNERTEDVLMAVENGRDRRLSTRMIERRREELNQLDEVENRMQRPQTVAAGPSPLKVLLAVDAADKTFPTDEWGQN